jgi:hypothetical protein
MNALREGTVNIHLCVLSYLINIGQTQEINGYLLNE